MDELLLGASLSPLLMLVAWAGWRWLREPLAAEAQEDAPQLDDWMDSRSIARRAVYDPAALDELARDRTLLRRVLSELLARYR